MAVEKVILDDPNISFYMTKTPFHFGKALLNSADIAPNGFMPVEAVIS